MNIATLWFAADVVIKATAILLAAWALCTIMPSAPSSRRHLIWFLSLASVLLLPVLGAVLPEWRLLPNWAATAPQSFHQVATDIGRADAPAEFATRSVDSEPSQTLKTSHFTAESQKIATLSPSTIAPPASSKPSLSPILNLGYLIAALWLVGFGLLLSRIVLARISLWRLAVRSAIVSEGEIAALFAEAARDLRVRLTAHLLMSDDRAMPMTWASLRPKILLPADARSWSRNRLRMALLHELAHVKRWDAATQLVGQLACAVLWFHPLAWLASRGLLREQEQAADDLVLGRCNCATDYASFLLDVARMMGSQRSMMRGAIAMARPKTLASRLEAVLDASQARQGLGMKHLVLGIAMTLVLLLPLASLHAQREATRETPTTVPSTATTIFFGHILSPDGKPIGNADIVLMFGWENAISRTRSATDGSFAISGPITPTRYSIAVASVRADGIGFDSEMLSSEKDNIIRIKPSSSVRVTFLDPDGKPIAGMRVWPTFSSFGRLVSREIGADSDFGSIEYPSEWSGDYALRTDADGACVITMLPRQATTALEIDRAEFAQPTTEQRIRTGASAQSLPVTIRLQPGGSIAGRVIDSKTGKGVAGIHLLAISRKPQHSLGRAVSGQDGEYRISQLLPGKYVIHLNEREAFPRTAAFRGNVEVFAGQTTGGQDLTLVDGTVVTGRLIEPDTGRGVASALIYAIDLKTDEYPGTSETDSDGRFSLRVPPGDEGIYLGSPPPEGYTSEGFDSVNYRVKEFKAIDGQNLTIDLKLTLKPGKPVFGRVLDPDGHPASGVYVQCRGSNDYSRSNQSQVKTDANGSFRFRAIGPGSQLTVLNGDMGTGEPVSVEGGEENIVLHLLPHVRMALIGRLVDKQGNPFPNVGLYLSCFGRGFGVGPMSIPDVLTDAQGRFRIPGLISGWQYKLTIASHGHDPSRTIDIHYKPGDTICDLGAIREEN